jgi:LSD1 subclass zinc finger protein
MDSLLTIGCPSCSRQLKLPTAAMGKNVKCPVCQAVFKFDAESSAAVPMGIDNPAGVTARPPLDTLPVNKPLDDDDAELPRRRRVDDDDDRPLRRRQEQDDDRRPRRRDDDDDDIRHSRRRRRSSYDDDYEDDRDYRRRQRRMDDAVASIAGPAIALMVVGIVTIIVSLLLVFLFMFVPAHNQEDRGAKVFLIILSMIGVFWGGTILVGGIMMKSMKSFAFAMAASIMALVPYPCLIFNIALGIWALVVLSDADVRKAFEWDQR